MKTTLALSIIGLTVLALAKAAEPGKFTPPRKSIAEIRTSPEFESFLANFIAAVNSKDREKYKAILHL